MGRDTNDNLAGIGSSNPEKADRKGFIDIHCHCLSGIDDGPGTQEESVALCRALVADGVSVVIATPHQLGRFGDGNENAQIRETASLLNSELKGRNIDLTVVAGADVRVDERICELIDSDRILTLADGGKYILLELPHGIFIDIEPLLVELSERGIQAIITHPERHSFLAREADILLRWLEHSVQLQITAGSLLGYFGTTVQSAAWHFLSSGMAKLVATDAHDLDGRRPCMRDAFENITNRLDIDIAELVCIENPLRVLKSRDVISFNDGVRGIGYKVV